MITKFIYDQTQTPISFEVGNGIMVNATEMAKPFGKEIKHWSENNSTTEFIVALAKARGIAPNPQYANLLKINDVGKLSSLKISDLALVFPTLLKVVKGGLQQQGTWFHEDIALVFAQWLSPEFYIWCNDRIKELLTKGHTELKVPQSFAEALQLAADQAKQIEEQQKALQAAAPKVEFADTVASSDSSILVGELAKLVAQKGVKIGQNRLFEYLRNNGYLCTRNGNKNYPTQRSINQGLLEVVERAIPKPDGSCIVTFTTKVTGKGQVYFVNALKGKF